MSLKFERDRDTVVSGASSRPSSAPSSVHGGSRALQGPIRHALEGPHIPGTSGKHPVAEAVGTALTGGRSEAGVKGYLAVCIALLFAYPLFRRP